MSVAGTALAAPAACAGTTRSSCPRGLADEGGRLAVLCGRNGVAFELPEPIERLQSDVPSGPPLARAKHEGQTLRRAL